MQSLCGSFLKTCYPLIRTALSVAQLIPSNYTMAVAASSTAAASSSIFASSQQLVTATRSASSSSASVSISNQYVSNFMGGSLRKCHPIRRKFVKAHGTVAAAVVPAVARQVEEVKEYSLTTWAEFDLGRAPIYWKTPDGLPPTSGGKLKLFYNPAANNMIPNEDFGIAFNGGFNQPIMCGGEPRAMLQKVRGKADPPLYTIQIGIPMHALNLIFSFTNGTEWDGPYRLQFQVPKAWRNKPIEFFAEGLAEELSKEGACDRAIFPDTNLVITRCAIAGNPSAEGGDRCNLDLVPGCTDPSSPLFNPLATYDDGSCPPYSDSED